MEYMLCYYGVRCVTVLCNYGVCVLLLRSKLCHCYGVHCVIVLCYYGVCVMLLWSVCCVTMEYVVCHYGVRCVMAFC